MKHNVRHYHPASRTGAFSGHVMTHSTILAGTTLLTLLPMFAWRTQILTAAQRQQHEANATHRHIHFYSCMFVLLTLYVHFMRIFVSQLPCACDLQCSCVARTACALPCDMVACGIVLALAFLLAVVSIGAGLTTLLTTPATEASCADTSTCDWVTQRSIFTLTPVTAVRTPVATVTCCMESKHGQRSGFNVFITAVFMYH